MALTSDQITAQNFADFYQKILPYLNGGGMGMKLLWENSDPTSNFAAQNITLDSDDYDLLLFIGRAYVTTPQSISTIAPKGTSALLICNAGNDLHGCQRNFVRTNDTEYAASDAMETSGSGTATANSRAIPYRIYGIKVYNREGGGISAEDYTTSEKAIGTWIDGKTLYQKVIDCGALPNNTRKEVAHNITNMDMYFIKNAFAYKSGASFAMNMYDLDYPTYSVRISMNNTNVQIYTKEDMSSYTKSYAVVCYTKTS